MVFYNEKHVFVMFYSPFCSFSKESLPKIEQIAYDLRDVKNLIIAKIDCYNNEVNEDVRGFPTLRLYFAKGKDYVQFNGERTVSFIKKFILENIKPQYEIDL